MSFRSPTHFNLNPNPGEMTNTTTMPFPPELLIMIFGYSKRRDLKSLRIVCRAFDTLAVPLLFDQVLVTARYADLERANQLATRFHAHVKTLLLHSEHFRKISRPAYGKEIKSQYAAFGLRDYYRKDEVDKQYIVYHKLRAEQEELFDSGDFLAQLCHMLSILKKLRNIVLTDSRPYRQDMSWPQQAWLGGCSRVFAPWTVEDSERRYFSNYEGSTSDKRFIAPAKGLKYHDRNPWPVVLCALNLSKNSKVEEIVTEQEYSHHPLTIHAFHMTRRQEVHAIQVLPNLTILRIHVDKTFWECRPEELEVNLVIPRTMSTASNLRVLEINVFDELWDEELDVESGQATTTF